MYTEICKIGPFTIFSYGLMLVIAFLVATYLSTKQAKKEKINPEIISNLLFIAFISGIAGARIFYISYNLSFYLKNPLEILMFQHGGMSWFGGLILGLSASIFYIKKKGLSIYKILDLIIPFVALAQAIGRIGCLLNGCCFGRETSGFGLYFPVHDAVLIPTQIYSSFLLVIIFIVLRFLQERPHKSGEIFFSYLLLYSLKRFFIEFWRADNPAFWLGLTLFQLLCVLMFVIALVKLISMKQHHNT